MEQAMEQAMQCCGHAFTRRRWMWGTLMASAGAMFAGCAASGRGAESSEAASAGEATAAQKLLKDNISVDVHTHAGLTGVTSQSSPSGDLAQSMRAGGMAIVCLADVPDAPIRGRNASNVLTVVRQPEPGQLYRHHLERIAWMDELVAGHGVRRVLTVADLKSVV